MKQIEGYERYSITVNGVIINTNTGRVLKQSQGTLGYPKINLFKDGKGKRFYIHRLLAKAFLPTIEGKFQINHKNGIRHDNRLENLEWSTQKENIQHAHDIGLFKTGKFKKD